VDILTSDSEGYGCNQPVIAVYFEPGGFFIVEKDVALRRRILEAPETIPSPQPWAGESLITQIYHSYLFVTIVQEIMTK
jgi:hypothetical protein